MEPWIFIIYLLYCSTNSGLIARQSDDSASNYSGNAAWQHLRCSANRGQASGGMLPGVGIIGNGAI